MRILRYFTARLVPSSPLESSSFLPVVEQLRAATLEAFDDYCPASCAGDPSRVAPGVRRREAAAVAALVRLKHILAAAE